MAMWKRSGDPARQPPHDDDDIRAAVRAHDLRDALTLMMNRYGDEVYRFAYAMTHSAHLAEEVRQQVFVEVYRDLPSFEGRASLSAWVLGITRHRCLDAAKKHRRWVHRFKNEPPTDEASGDDELEREVDRGKLAKILAICLAKLAPAARDAVVLRYHRDLSYDEASAISARECPRRGARRAAAPDRAARRGRAEEPRGSDTLARSRCPPRAERQRSRLTVAAAPPATDSQSLVPTGSVERRGATASARRAVHQGIANPTPMATAPLICSCSGWKR